MGWVHAVLVALVVAATACRPDASLFLERTWGENDLAVLVLQNEEGARLHDVPLLVKGGDTVELTVETEQLRVFVRVYDPPESGGPSLVECGVRFGEANPLPPAKANLVSALIQPSSQAPLVLETEQMPRNLGLQLGPCPEETCPRLVASWIASDLEDSIHQIAVVSPDVIVFGLDQAATTVEPTKLGILSDAGVELLPTDQRLLGNISSLAWDGREWVWGLTNQNILFRMTPDGTIVHLTTPRARIRALDATIDGVVYGLADVGLVDLVAGSTLAFPTPGVVRFRAVRRDRIAAMTETDIYFYDGVEWMTEESLVMAPTRSYDTLFGDEDVLVAAGRPANTLVRTSSVPRWVAIGDPPNPGRRVRAGAAFGKGRFVVAGVGGVSGVWSGRGWCDLAGLDPRIFNCSDTTLDGRVLYFSGQPPPGGTAPFLRFDVAE